MDDLSIYKVFIKVHDPDNHDLIDQIVKSLKNAIDSDDVDVSDSYSEEESSQKALELIDLIFYVVIGIMMFLCFFALQSSMMANLYEQTKEIAVLRSIGMTGYRISTLYFYEALLLVFASCLLGIVIGVLVGFTMVLQQDLFLNQQTKFYFPWRQTIEIFALSIVCAFLSTYGPALQLTRKSISAIFRSV